MTFLQRVICELHKKFKDEEGDKHPNFECWYFKGVDDFLQFMFRFLERHPTFAMNMMTAILDEESEREDDGA